MGVRSFLAAAARGGTPERERSGQPLSVEDYIWQLQQFNYLGHNYAFGGLSQTSPGKPQEDIANSFCGYVQQAYKQNGIVFACILARMSLFSQARFAFRRLRQSKPGDLFGTPELSRLERPWQNATTGDLLARMEQDASLGGNAFVLDRGSRLGLWRIRPDWTSIVLGTQNEDVEPKDIWADPDVEVLGYAYTNGGMYSGNEPEVYPARQVAHYAPIPDPEAAFRGMSWITPVVIEVMGDKAASEHKLGFFESGGTPNMTVEYNPEFVKDRTAFDLWKASIEDQISTFGPTYRRLHLGGGTKATVVGANFGEADFKSVQGAGETRIAAAAGVPAAVVGISEGLQGSALNAGNYQAAMRRFADMTVRWLWQNACGSLAPLIAVPSDAELWYDDDHIPALQVDRQDAADIQGKEAQTIAELRREGFVAESIIAAVVNNDWTLLKHDGSPSVQTRPAEPPAKSNGQGDAAAVPPPPQQEVPA